MPADDPAGRLMGRLGLSEDELCRVLGTDALSIISGAVDADPRVGILLDLTAEAGAHVSAATLRAWTRREPQFGHLMGGDFAAYEDDLGRLRERGFRITRAP